MGQQGTVFIFLGSPGAGKGSLSKLCTEQLGWKQLSTGNLCRKHIADQTKIGKEIDLIIKSGKLISDDLVNQMVFEWFSESAGMISNVILDGYPRTVTQAEAFDIMIKTNFPQIQLNVIELNLPDEVIIARLNNRFICQNKECQMVYSSLPGSSCAPKQKGRCDVCSSPLVKREDDDDVSIKKRLIVHHKHEKQLLDFFNKNGQKVIRLDVNKPLQKVFDDFCKMVG